MSRASPVPVPNPSSGSASRIVVAALTAVCASMALGWGRCRGAPSDGGTLGPIATDAGAGSMAPPLFPEPPAQHEPWSPPQTSLPPSLVAVASVLFDQGLADPRGLAYHEVELRVGSVWTKHPATVKTRAWVMPGAGEPRYAVSYSGLVYPVLSVGAPADLRADVLASIAADKAKRDKAPPSYDPERPFERSLGATPEDQAVAADTMNPLRVALLWRVGETELAERLWEAWGAGMNGTQSEGLEDRADPYRMLAKEWVWFLYDRAVTAHMRSDDRLALATARMLVPAAAKVEAECDRRAFVPTDWLASEGVKRHLTFADDVGDLLADQERRARPRDASSPVPEPGSVDELIERLDEMSVQQNGQPGAIRYEDDPTVRDLKTRSGDDDQARIWSAIQRDKRLTRTVGFHRDFMRERAVRWVRAPLRFVYGDRPPPQPTGKEKRVITSAATAIAAYSRAIAARTLSQFSEARGVLYTVLADDKAHPAEWVHAARSIAHDPSDHGSGPSKLSGEELRARTSPSVSTLLASRLAALRDAVGPACELAGAFGRWDPAAAQPHLAEPMRRALEASRSAPFGWCIGPLATARAAAGDTQALDEYAAWIVDAPVRLEWLTQPEKMLKPFWAFPDHPAIADAARRLFREGSPWWPRMPTGKQLGAKLAFTVTGLASSRLALVDPYRQLVLRALADKTRIGVVTVEEGPRHTTAYDAGGGPTGFMSKDDPDVPRVGTKRTYRVADYFAEQIARRVQRGLYQRYWDDARRDRGIAAVVAWLASQPAH